jgi:hypothetical protein
MLEPSGVDCSVTPTAGVFICAQAVSRGYMPS